VRTSNLAEDTDSTKTLWNFSVTQLEFMLIIHVDSIAKMCFVSKLNEEYKEKTWYSKVSNHIEQTDAGLLDAARHWGF